ncbi:HPr family phosphocarrier protein [Butyrivibrio sp. INlla16]|uniref:HPr family phosphocarrier protein n=1 Tax=Butyrivibrio sp. INlla16 TaxID=1520807 RepID=UPI0008864F69|nr:HPr family phosphocarrier protein [Butyrivibrio sp. INlla16]SDB57214.1 PTS HPr component phosphorylation site [Butyrivibrio sp. INlla16]
MSKKIRLNPDQVKDFVRAASKCDFDVDISYNHLTVDAKSLLGVFGMNFRYPLKVSYRGYNQDFENYLAEHVVA